jgi:transcriptional regulator with XRE-family HTH domain
MTQQKSDETPQATERWYAVPGLFKLYRQQAGITQEELAKRANVSQALISQLENGGRAWTDDAAEKIVNAYSDLLGERYSPAFERFKQSPEYAEYVKQAEKKYGKEWQASPFGCAKEMADGFSVLNSFFKVEKYLDAQTALEFEKEKNAELEEEANKWHNAFDEAMKVNAQLIADKTGTTAADFKRILDERDFLRDLLRLKVQETITQKEIEEKVQQYKREHGE